MLPATDKSTHATPVLDKAELAAAWARLGPFRTCERLGLAYRRDGHKALVLCPWHSEKLPSCAIRVGQQGTIQVRCFGSCAKNWDIHALVARLKGLDPATDFAAVLTEEADMLGSYQLTFPLKGKPLPIPPQPEPTLSSEQFVSLVKPLLWVGRLDDSTISSDATTYLRGRCLLEAAVADEWACLPGTSDSQASWIQMLLDVFGEETVRVSGLVAGKRFVHPHNRLLIPWRDKTGCIQTLQRRLLPGKDGSAKYVFPKGRPPCSPYGSERLGDYPADTPIVFVEGATDVLARRILDARQGIGRVVLGVPGGGWRTDWARLGRDRVVYVAADSDKTGEALASRWADDLYQMGAKDVIRLKTSTSKDWSDACHSKMKLST